MPTNLTRGDLLAVLDEIRAGVASGDTLEGSIQFTLNYDEPPAAHPYDVLAAYRIGNLQGQGGMRMIGHPANSPVPRRLWVDSNAQVWVDADAENGIEYVHQVTALSTAAGIADGTDRAGAWDELAEVRANGLRQIGVIR